MPAKMTVTARFDGDEAIRSIRKMSARVDVVIEFACEGAVFTVPTTKAAKQLLLALAELDELQTEVNSITMLDRLRECEQALDHYSGGSSEYFEQHGRLAART